jgi:uncharacterized coiled-coil protein SlyX
LQDIVSPSVTQHLDERVGRGRRTPGTAISGTTQPRDQDSGNRIAALESQLSEATAAQAPLNTRIADLEAQLSAAGAAQGPLNNRIAELENILASKQLSYVATITCLEERLSDYQQAYKDSSALLPTATTTGQYGAILADFMNEIGDVYTQHILSRTRCR